jgi:energy-coupling factor transport system permease protein
VLAGVLAGLVAAAAGAGVLAQLRRAALLAVPAAVIIAAINALVYREGAHVIFRGGTLLGRRLDLTLESLTAGGVAAFRLVIVAAAFGLYSAAVDPDEMLRLFRRVSYRSALTGSLATRLAHVLHGDARRMSEAARCRPDPPGRGRVLTAVLTRSLDRAVDVAAALEVRGYAHAKRPASGSWRRPWSRHDVRVATAALLVVAATVAGKLAGAGGFNPYPKLDVPGGPPELLLAGVFALAGALPFAGARARLGVARG